MKSPLNRKERYELEKLVEQKRNMYNLGLNPLGEGIFQLADQLNIHMLYLPIDLDTEASSLSAVYLSSNEKNDQPLTFIGINTAQHYDLQIFATAHELYHHFESQSDMFLCRDLEQTQDLREKKANYFAAAFLLPEKALQQEIYRYNDYRLNLDNWELLQLLRFIAKLHLNYKLPYKAIVRRLSEINALTDEWLYRSLYSQDVRDKGNTYYKIAMSYDSDQFAQLNKKTKKIGADPTFMEIMITNFEDSLVGIDELAKDFSLFDISIREYGLTSDEENAMDDLMRELEDSDES